MENCHFQVCFGFTNPSIFAFLALAIFFASLLPNCRCPWKCSGRKCKLYKMCPRITQITKTLGYKSRQGVKKYEEEEGDFGMCWQKEEIREDDHKLRRKWTSPKNTACTLSACGVVELMTKARCLSEIAGKPFRLHFLHTIFGRAGEIVCNNRER